MLVRRAAAGDHPALRLLLEELYPRVRVFFRGWLFHRRDREEVARDLTQDTMARVVEHVSGCHAEVDGQVVEWALMIARRVGVDFIRAQREEWERRVQSIDPALSPAPATADLPVGLDIVTRIVEHLYIQEPKHIQEVLWRRLLERETWAEIGIGVGTTESGAKRMFQRAQKRLRRRAVATVRALPSEEKEAALKWLGALAPLETFS